MAVVYQHRRNDTNEIFYIGIGNEIGRAYSIHGRNKYWKNIVNKFNYTVEILFKDLNLNESRNIEKYLISWYGRKDLGTGELVNMTDGGESTINISDETRRKIGNANLGKKRSIDTLKKLSESHIGNYHSKETKLKMSESSMGIKNPFFGKTHSEETINKYKEIVTCPHCGKIGGSSGMKSSHFDNCKLK